MRVKLTNEYYYKLIMLVCGILFFTYGFMPYMDFALQVMTIVLLLLTIHNMLARGISKYQVIGIIAVLFGLTTLIICKYKYTTAVLLFYSAINLLFLPCCDNQKKLNVIKKELETTAKIVTSLSLIVSTLSLATFFLGIHKLYTYPGWEDELDLGIHMDTGALVGIYSNANALSALIVYGIGFTLYLRYESKHKGVLEIILFLLYLTLFLTQSRGGIIGGIFIMIFYFFFSIKKRSVGVNDKYILLFPVIAVGSCVIAKIISMLMKATGSNILADSSTSARFALWIAGIKVATHDIESFLFGVGGNFRYKIAENISSSIPERLYRNMHNIYIHTLVVFGIIGLLFLMYFIYVYVWKNFLAVFKNTKEYYNLQPLIGMLMATLVINLVESDLYMGKTFLASLFWITCGYIDRIIAIKRLNTKHNN